MGLLDTLYEWQGRGQGLSDAARMRVLQKMGLDPTSQALKAQQQGYGQQASQLKGVLGQFGPDVAKQLGPMIQSDNPNVAAQGNALLQSLMQQRYQTPEGTAATQSRDNALQAQVLGNIRQAQEITQANQADPLTLDALRAQIEASRASTQSSYTTRFLANQKAQAEQAFANMPPQEYFKQVDETKGLSESVGALRKLTTLVRDYSHLGRFASPEIRGRTQGMILSIIPALQSALNRGGQNALGTEERQFAIDLLGNPNNLLSMDSTTSARLDEILGRLERDYTFHKETRSQFLPPSAFDVPDYTLPPGLIPLGMGPQGGMGPQPDPGVGSMGMAPP